MIDFFLHLNKSVYQSLSHRISRNLVVFRLHQSFFTNPERRGDGAFLIYYNFDYVQIPHARQRQAVIARRYFRRGNLLVPHIRHTKVQRLKIQTVRLRKNIVRVVYIV